MRIAKDGKRIYSGMTKAGDLAKNATVYTGGLLKLVYRYLHSKIRD